MAQGLGATPVMCAFLEHILWITATTATSDSTTNEGAVVPQLSSALPSPVPSLVPRIALRGDAKMVGYCQKMVAGIQPHWNVHIRVLGCAISDATRVPNA